MLAHPGVRAANELFAARIYFYSEVNLLGGLPSEVRMGKMSSRLFSAGLLLAVAFSMAGCMSQGIPFYQGT